MCRDGRPPRPDIEQLDSRSGAHQPQHPGADKGQAENPFSYHIHSSISIQQTIYKF